MYNRTLHGFLCCRDFQSRVARATMSEIQDGIDAPPMQRNQRDHLGDLRAKGRHQKVGSQRVGSAKQGKGNSRTVLITIKKVL